MSPWFKQFQALIWAASIAVGVAAYAFGAMATKEYVNIKHDGVLSILMDIRSDVKEIRQNIIDLSRSK